MVAKCRMMGFRLHHVPYTVRHNHNRQKQAAGGKGPAGSGAAPPGWLRSLGKKLAMNVTLKVENLTVQYEEEGAGVVASAYIW